MKRVVFYVSLLAPIIACASAHAGSLTLASGGESEYRIVTARDATPDAMLAARELEHCLAEISGTRLDIVPDTEKIASKEIVIGLNRHSAQLLEGVGLTPLGDEGYNVRTVGESLIIAGRTDRGTLNGVYAFLESQLGCRWFTPETTLLPRTDILSIPPMNESYVPPIHYREVYYAEAMDQIFARRHRLNGNASVIEDGRMAKENHPGWGLWCHSFFELVPPDKYFEEHPEYFSLVDGKRVRDKQLCLTNPDVFDICVASLREMMDASPDMRYWSVSQNDCHGNCECDNCKALDEQEGTPMGSLLAFTNRIAAVFPDKTISTLAYQYTRRPPKTLKPEPNVLINLCSIECNRSHSIATDPGNASFRDDVKAWSAICDNLFIWDYVVQFSNLLSPFPNLRVLQPDVRFFVENNAKGLFSQGNREAQGEFCELRTYLLAKLQWDPNCDIEQHMNEFLNAYYGPAADPIREYIDLAHDKLEESGKWLYIFAKPDDHRDGFMSEELLKRYAALFDEAERLVEGQPDLLLRVKTARIPVMFIQLELRYGPVEERARVADALFETADKIGLRMFNEWDRPTELYRKQIKEALAKERANK